MPTIRDGSRATTTQAGGTGFGASCRRRRGGGVADKSTPEPVATETNRDGHVITSGHSSDLSAKQEFIGRPRTDWVVFGITAGIMFALVLWGGLGTDSLSSTAAAALDWLITNTGWGFVLAATGFVFFALFLAFSRYGRIPLGQDDEEPEFRTVSWIAMMFSAGMGIGL